MMAAEIRSRLEPRKWTVKGHDLCRDGEPQIDLRTVTKAHYVSFQRSGNNNGLHLSSPTNTVVISQVRNQKQLKRTVVKTLEALHRCAPDVRVHMRGGVAAEVSMLFVGLSCLGTAAWLAIAVTLGSGELSGVAVGFVLLLLAFSGFCLRLFYPWDRQRFYATPKEAARAIVRHGRSVVYQTFRTHG